VCGLQTFSCLKLSPASSKRKNLIIVLKLSNQHLRPGNGIAFLIVSQSKSVLGELSTYDTRRIHFVLRTEECRFYLCNTEGNTPQCTMSPQVYFIESKMKTMTIINKLNSTPIDRIKSIADRAMQESTEMS
jgi:hypothetical protein